jgi:hypothetical protein
MPTGVHTGGPGPAAARGLQHSGRVYPADAVGSQSAAVGQGRAAARLPSARTRGLARPDCPDPALGSGP